MPSKVPSRALPFLGSLARSPRAEDRLLWLRVAVDYFLADSAPEAGLSAEFEANFAACLAGADEESRLAVAKKLVSRGHTPAYLLAAIEALGGDAASFVLESAHGLPRDKLLADAAEKGRARAIARRDDLDEELTWTIVRSGDPEASVALIENPRAALKSAQFAALALNAKGAIESTGDRRLGEALLARTPTRAEFAPLFLEANSAQRTLILLAVQRAELGRPRLTPTPRAPRETIAELELHALAGESERFARSLAQTLQCAPGLAERIASDPWGEPLAVALAAIGAPNDVSVRILTSSDLRDGADYRRVGALARLQGALSASAARRVIVSIVESSGGGDSLEPRQSLPVRPASELSVDRRQRPALGSQPRDDTVPAAVLRRRRAFAFLAAHHALGEK